MKKTARFITSVFLVFLFTLSSLSGIPIAFADGQTAKLASGWEIIRENANIIVNDNDSVTITTEGWGSGYSSVPNVVSRTIPNGDFVITAKVTGGLSSNFQAVGVCAFVPGNTGQIVTSLRRYHNYLFPSNSARFGMMHEGGQGTGEAYAPDATPASSAYLKLERNGNNYIATYSFDKVNWFSCVNDERLTGAEQTNNVRTHTTLSASANVAVGFFASSGGANSARAVTISEFELNGVAVPIAGDNSITAVSNPSALRVVKGTAFAALPLPGVVSATLTNGANIDFNVSWSSSGYDGNTLGTYTLEGTLAADEQMNPLGLKPSIDVIVTDEDPSTHRVASPDGRIVATVTLDPTGAATYSVSKNGVEYIESGSPLAINTGYGDFSTGLTFVSVERDVIDETYPMVAAKFSTYINKANEMTLTFQKGSRQIKVIFRAYDDGAAFRYAIDGTGTTTASSETSGFKLKAGSLVTAMPYNSSYESNYTVDMAVASMATGTNYGMPVFVKAPDGTNVLIAQADLYGTYVGTRIRRSADTTLQLNFASGTATLALPWASPWRCMVVGDPATIVETMMFENLSPPCAIEDTSWIQPGITTWTWLNGVGTANVQGYKDYIDLAKEMGWQFVLLDEGWQPRDTRTGGGRYYGIFDWTQEVLDYAKERGIGVIVWSHVDDLRTPERRERLQEWADLGIVGVKSDFYSNESQSELQVYDAIEQATADAKLFLNHHGSNMPSGRRRTYPHVMAREGLRGAEQRSTTAVQGVWFTYIRNVVGDMDYTPCLRPSMNSQLTAAHNLALTVAYQCGTSCFADLESAYRASGGYNFLRYLPVVWDQTKLIAGVPGQYTVMGRRNGDDWYVGAITDTARNYTMSLDFLGDGEYNAFIYTEGSTTSAIDFERRVVTKNDTILLPMKSHGGVAIHITKSLPVSYLQHVIDRANQTLNNNTQYIADYVTVRSAAVILRSEIAIAEGVVLTPVSIDNLFTSITRLSDAIDEFLEVRAALGSITLQVPEISLETPIFVAPKLPSTVQVIYPDGPKSLDVVWDAVSPEKYAAPGTFDVEGVIEDAGRYVIAHVTVFDMSIDIVPGDNVADVKFVVIAVGKPQDYLTILTLYDKDGNLVKTDSKTGSLSAAGDWDEITMSIDQERGYTVKAFLWDAKTYIPLIINATHEEPWIVDKSALLTALDTARAITLGTNTALSWDHLQAAIANGQTVYDNEDSTRTMINREAANINEAIDNLVSRIVNLNELPGMTHYGTAGTYGSGRTYNMIFDGNINTFYDAASNTNYNCGGINLGSDVTATLHYVRVYPRSDFLDRANATIRGNSSQPTVTAATSVNGGTQFSTISGISQARWYQFNSTNTTTELQYFWVAFASGSWGNLAEVEFWGIPSGTDRSLLNDRIAYAQSLSAADYSTGWEEMQTALNAATGLTTSATQAQVDTAAANLKYAINNLVHI